MDMINPVAVDLGTRTDSLASADPFVGKSLRLIEIFFQMFKTRYFHIEGIFFVDSFVLGQFDDLIHGLDYTRHVVLSFGSSRSLPHAVFTLGTFSLVVLATDAYFLYLSRVGVAASPSLSVAISLWLHGHIIFLVATSHH